jgi:hypothetical protein
MLRDVSVCLCFCTPTPNVGTQEEKQRAPSILLIPTRVHISQADRYLSNHKAPITIGYNGDESGADPNHPTTRLTRAPARRPQVSQFRARTLPGRSEVVALV